VTQPRLLSQCEVSGGTAAPLVVVFSVVALRQDSGNLGNSRPLTLEEVTFKGKRLLNVP
jgi:hypothetical protein